MVNPKSKSDDDKTSLFKEVEYENFLDYFDKNKLFLGLKKYSQFFIVIAILSGLLGGYYYYKFKTTYKAEAILLYHEKRSSGRDLKGGYILPNISLGTILDIIMLPSNIDAVKSLLGLDLSTEEIKRMISVQSPKRNSNLIVVTATGQNENLVIDVANALAKVAVKSCQDFYQKQIGLALVSYRNQLGIVKQRLEDQIADIEEYKVRNQYFEMDADYTGVTQQIATSREQLHEAETEYNRLLAEYVNLKKEVESLPNTPLMNKDLVSKIQSNLADARARYTTENPKVKLLEKQLEEITGQNGQKSNARIVSRDEIELELLRLRGKLRSAQKVKHDMMASAAVWNEKIQALPGLQMEFFQLLQFKELTERQLRDLDEAVEAAELLMTVPNGSAELYKLANESTIWKKRFWIEALPLFAILFGLTGAMGVALGVEMMDRKLRTPKEIDLAYKIPCKIQIPDFKHLTRENRGDKFLYFIRRLVDRLSRFIDRASQGHSVSLAVTSGINGEGKGVIAHQLAEYYCKLGRKTLLIAGNGESETIGKKSANTKFLEEYLSGKAEASSIIDKGSVDTLYLSPSKGNTKELLMSERMQELWKQLDSSYDLIVIQTPSILSEEYAVNLMKLSDGVLFVIGSDITEKKFVNQSLELLQGAGVYPDEMILNRVDPIYIEDFAIKQELKKDKR